MSLHPQPDAATHESFDLLRPEQPRHEKRAFRVVCAVDGKLPAKFALRWAVEVARAVQARPEVFVLAAVDADVPEVHDLAKREPHQLAGAALHAKEITRSAVDSLGPDRAVGVLLRQHGLAGRPTEAILLATEYVDLVVVGHARSGLSRVIWGSFADNLIRHCNTPVMVVPLPDHGAHIRAVADLPSAQPIKSILCPTPLGPEGVALVAYAGFIAGLLHASLRVVHVHTDAGAVERAEAEFGELSSQAPAPAGDHKVSYELRKAPSVTEAVLAMARDSVQLVIMGSHGRSGMEKARLGSTAEKLLSEVSCPILVVPGEKRHPLTKDKVFKAHAQVLF